MKNLSKLAFVLFIMMLTSCSNDTKDIINENPIKVIKPDYPIDLDLKVKIFCERKFFYPQGKLEYVISDFSFEKNFTDKILVFKSLMKESGLEVQKVDFIVMAQKSRDGEIALHDGKEEEIKGYGTVYVNPNKIQVNGYIPMITAIRYTLKNTKNSDVIKSFYTGQEEFIKDSHIGGPL